MNEIAAVLNDLVSGSPVLGRALFVSLELCVLVPVLATLIKFNIIRTHRLQSLFWTILLLNALTGLAFRAPVSVALWENEAAPVPPLGAMINDAYTPVSRNVPAVAMERQQPLQPTGVSPSTLTTPMRVAPVGVAQPTFVSWWWPKTLTDWLGCLWGLGVACCVGRLLVDRWRLYRLLGRTVAPSERLEGHYLGEAGAIGFGWRPALRVTRDLETPAIVGVLRPVILVPQWLEREGTAEQWTWTLRHELTHWHHGDTLGQLLRLAAQALLFFHPLVWWAGKRWEEAAELACDRSLLKTESDAVGYAQELCALLGMIGKRQRPLMSTGLFASRTYIGRRIETLLADPLARPARLGMLQRTLALLSLGLLMGVGIDRATATNTAVAPVAMRGLSAAPASGQHTPPPARVLHFPEEYSMGSLNFGDDSVEARGTVTIPEGAHVSLGINDLGAGDLSPLSNFGPNDIQSLSLSGTSVQDEQFVHLQGLTGLGRLELRETLITDEGMQYLSGMTQLTRLNLNGTAVGDEGMRHLGGMTQMESLILNRTAVGDEGLSYLRDMTALTELDMWMLDITDEGMQYLAGMTNMYELGIEDTLITDAGLRYLQGMQNLYQLNLENNNITDAGLEYLIGLQQLARLGLSDTYLTEAGMALLAQMPNLQAARLPVQIGPEGLKHLEGTAVANYLASNAGELQPVTVSITGAGRPLPNAHFSLAQNPSSGDREIYFFRTGPTGSARLYLPTKSIPYILRGFAEGYVTNEAAWDAPLPAVLRLDLEAAASIGGSVVDENGSPVAGVAVSIPVLGGHNWDSEETLPHTVNTDSDGRWVCDVAPRKLVDFWISLDHRDYATTTYTMADLSVAALHAGTAVLTIANPIGLPGLVVDESGLPLANVRLTELEKWRQYGMRATGRSAVTNEEGLFEIKPIRPGESMLKVNAAGYVPQSETVDIAAGMAPIRIVMKSSIEFRGRAVDEAGQPLAGLEVWVGVSAANGVRLGGWNGRTDKEGRFVWQEAPQGTMSVAFRLENESRNFSDVKAGEGEQEFVLSVSPMAEGLAEGKALMARFNQEHAPERIGPISLEFTVSDGFLPDTFTNRRHFSIVRAGDGRYREAVRLGKEDESNALWRHSWNGTQSVRHDQLTLETADSSVENPYVVLGPNEAPDHLPIVESDTFFLFSGKNSPTVRFEVMKFVDNTVTLGDDGKVAEKIRFKDLKTLAVASVERFDEVGRIVFAAQFVSWFEHNGVAYPSVIMVQQLPDADIPIESTYEIEPFKPIDLGGEDFTWAIPWEPRVLIQEGDSQAAMEVLRLDEKLFQEKRYLDAFTKFRESEETP